jgi:hypothetical protein
VPVGEDHSNSETARKLLADSMRYMAMYSRNQATNPPKGGADYGLDDPKIKMT